MMAHAVVGRRRLGEGLGGWLLLSVLITGGAHGQTVAFCSLVRVEPQRLSNAVRITLETNGAVIALADWQDFVEIEPDFHPKATDRIRFQLANARSEVGSLVQVGVYPVSHLLLSIPPEAKEGVGLKVEVVLYKSAVPRQVELSNLGFDFWESEAGLAYDLLISPNQRGIILTVSSDRQVPTPTASNVKERVEKGPNQLTVDYHDGLLSLHALNQEFHTVVQAIAEATGAPVMVAEHILHLTSAHFDGQPLGTALQALATVYGLSLRRLQDGTYLFSEGVVSDATSFGESLGVVIPLRYLPARDALNLLPNFLLAHVRLHEQRNALIVFGPQAMVDKLRQDVERLDQPSPMIEVEVVLLELERGTDLNLRPRWQVERRTTTYNADPLLGEWSYVAVARLPRTLDAQLVALQQRRRVRIDARARLKVLNGQESRLFVGSKRFFQVLRERFNFQEVELTSVDVGVQLRLMAVAGGDQVVTLRVTSEVNSVLAVEAGTNLLTLGVRQAENVVRVGQGETLILGGLRQHLAPRLHHKVPLLGDIPVIGELFRAYRQDEVSNEFLMLVTPRWRFPQRETSPVGEMTESAS